MFYFLIIFYVSQLPDKPPPIVEETRSQVDQQLLKRLQEVGRLHLIPIIRCAYISQLFGERAIWTRMSLLNQFSPTEARDIHKYV